MSWSGGSRSSPLHGPDGRLRTVQRLAVYLAITAALVVALQIVALNLAVFFAGPPPARPSASEQLPLRYLLPAQIASLVGITAVTLWARRRLDRRSLVSLGLQRQKGWLSDCAVGLMLGFALLALIFLVEWATALIAWDLSAAFQLWQLVGATVLFAMVAWSEELLLRGYVLQNLAEAWGPVPAAIVSSSLFSLLHFANPGANLTSALGLLLAGLLFAVSFFATDHLWLPMALHFSWNFFEGPVFGFPVSGVLLGGLLSTTQVGADLVTGGDFGPEAGLSGIVASALGIAVCNLYGRWRKRETRA